MSVPRFVSEQPTGSGYVRAPALIARDHSLPLEAVWVPPVPSCTGLPPLPHPHTMEPAVYLGPTEESNWVIPGRILVGAYPSALEDQLHTDILKSILQLGITTFVCLQHEYDHYVKSEEAWRSGDKLRPYIFDAVRLLGDVDASVWPGGCRPDGLEFVHFPIVDCAVVSDARVLKLCKDLVKRLLRGENLYIHCWGGHGRTGTVIAVMLGIAYGLGSPEALMFTQVCHDLRACPMGVPSPQTPEQRQQVVRILNAIQARRARQSEASAAAKPGHSVAGLPAPLRNSPLLSVESKGVGGEQYTSPVPAKPVSPAIRPPSGPPRRPMVGKSVAIVPGKAVVKPVVVPGAPHSWASARHRKLVPSTSRSPGPPTSRGSPTPQPKASPTPIPSADGSSSAPGTPTTRPVSGSTPSSYDVNRPGPIPARRSIRPPVGPSKNIHGTVDGQAPQQRATSPTRSLSPVPVGGKDGGLIRLPEVALPSPASVPARDRGEGTPRIPARPPSNNSEGSSAVAPHRPASAVRRAPRPVLRVVDPAH